jgi:hypothetical protein
MLLAMRIEGIGERLRGLGGVVDRHERGDPEFPEAAITWLRACEQLLLGLRIREGAELATLRGAIVKAGERLVDDDSGTSRRTAARRARAVAAADSLERANTLLQQIAAEAESRLRHFEAKLTEAMTAAVLVGLVEPPPDEPRERWLARVWQRLAAHQATRPTTVYLAAALHAPDRLYLLDRVLARLAEPDLGVLAPGG